MTLTRRMLTTCRFPPSATASRLRFHPLPAYITPPSCPQTDYTNSSTVPAASKANTMPRRLQTTWATLPRAHPLGQEDQPEQAPELQPIGDVLPLD